MEEVVTEVRGLISEGCGLVALLEFLRSSGSVRLTPFNVMRVLNEAAGIRMIESRELLSMFDDQLRPAGPTTEIDQKWRLLVEGHRR